MELLIVAALFPVIAFATYSNLNSGIRIWEAMQKETPDETAAIFYSKVTGELGNMFLYTPIPFNAEKDSITFAAPIQAPAALGGDLGFGELRYYFDEKKRMIFRQERNVSDLFKEKPGRARPLLTEVSSFKISFFTKDPLDKKYKWFEEWDNSQGKKLPIAVRFNFEASVAGITKNYSKVFRIPAGET